MSIAPNHRRLLSSILPMVALAGCAPATPPEPPSPCGGAIPAVLRVIEGGRVSFPRTGTLATEVPAFEGVEAEVTSDAVTLRAPYGAGAREVTVLCESGAAALRLEVEALRWAPVADWEPDAPAGSPGGREYFAWWLGPYGDRALYLYGGFAYEPRQFTPSFELFRFDLRSGGWSSVSLSGELPGPGGRVAVGPDGTARYFGGGAIGAGGGLDTPPGFFAIGHDGPARARFETLPSTGAPGSYTGALVYDAPRDRWLSVCGADAFMGIHCRVHAYAESTGWQQVAVAEGERPAGRYGFHYVHDAVNERVIVFGGQIGPDNLDLDAETWALELAPEGASDGSVAWSRLETPPEISPRRNGGYALDPRGHRMFVWGGTPDGRDSVPGLEVLSLDRGRERWEHLEPAGSPPSRTSGQGLYDEAEGRILWGMGNDDAVYTDLWELSVAPREGT
jgi:hypothetical protein